MKKYWFIAAGVFLTLLAATCIFPCVRCVSFTNRKNHKERVFSCSALKGFVISYTHSVNKGRVHDFYRCDADTLVLCKTEFVSYGAGIPEPEETPGAVFTVTDNNYVISGINRVVPKLVMAVGLVARHAITFDESFSVGQNEFYLTDFFEPQTSIIFEYKKVSLVDYLLHSL